MNEIGVLIIAIGFALFMIACGIAIIIQTIKTKGDE